MKTIITDDGVNIATKLSKAQNSQNKICILAHGITVDMTEGGIFDRLSAAIRSKSIDTIQFDYRGHGNSGGTSKGMTISGEILDISAIFDYCLSLGHDSIFLVSASFGAVSTSCLPLFYKKMVSKLVLWNPVLDLSKTFIQPVLPWGKASFNEGSIAKMEQTGSLFIDGEFEIGSTLVGEFKLYKPLESIHEYQANVLVLHGDQDTYVPYDVAKECASTLNRAKFITVPDSEHGFGREIDENLVINEALNFLHSEED